jgi:hypothetical protein
MGLAPGVLAVVPQQQDPRRPKYARQVDGLVAAVHPVENGVWIFVDAIARRTSDPIQAKLIPRLFRASPTLAAKRFAYCLNVVAPPAPVTRIEDIGERR